MEKVFNFILTLKDVKKSELVVTNDEEFIIDQFYNSVKNIASKKVFRNACLSYQIDTMNLDMYECCETISDEIIKRYKE